MANPSADDFNNLVSALGNLSGKIATQNDLLNAGPTSDDFQSLVSALNNRMADESSGETSEGTKATKEGTESTKKNTKSKDENTSAINKLGNKIGELGAGFSKFGAKLENLTSKLNQTQKDFGVSLAGAARMQMDAMSSSIKSFIDSFNSINVDQLMEGVGNILSMTADSAVEMAKKGISGNFRGVGETAKNLAKNIGTELTKPLPGPVQKQPVGPKEILEATKLYQDEFGVINKEMGAQLAQQAKDRGLNVQQLVQSQRVFATSAMGDMSKVASMQDRFFNVFQSKGMTPKVALEAITKYSELIARNGTRFADSFARAAADAKKIGFDLNKVSQFGDSIIDNFEGFLEGQATLGAMGFGFDSSRLAEIAATGDDAALFNELRSQLAATGKDITKLSRPERLELESAFGINISDMMKLAGLTPGGGKTQEEYSEESNSLLAKLVTLMAVGGPVFSLLGNGLKAIGTAVTAGGELFGLIKDIAFALGPFGALATIAAIAIWWKGKQDAAKLEELKTEGRRLISEGKISQGSEKLREAAYLESSGTAFTMGPGAGTAISPIIQRYNDEIKRLTDEYYRNNPSKAKEITESVYNATKPFTTPASQLPAGTISSPNPVNPLAPPVKKAQGGLITGPGSETSDSIPTRLSNGEFVVKADSVKKIGTDLLNKLNFGGKGALENAMYGAAPLSMMMRDLFRSDTGKAVVDSLDTVASVTSPLGDLLDSTRTGGKLGMFSDIVSGVDATYALSRGQYKKAGNVALEFAKGKTVQSFLSRLRIPGPVGLVAGMGAQQTYSAYQQQKKMPHNQGKNLLFYTGRDYGAMPEVRHPVGTGNTFLDKAFGAYSRFYKKDQQPGMLPPVKVTAPRYHKGGIVGGDKTELPAILQRGEAVLSKLQIGSLSNLIGKFNTIAGLGGKLSDNVSGLKEKALGFATSKIPGIGGILGGGLGGLKEKALGFATSKIPGLSGVMDVYKQGGLKGVGTSLLNKGVGALGKKVPGLSGAMSAISAFKTGGVKSALGSLTKGGIGKAIGGAIGTAIPIPGVGTMIGSMLGSKLTNLASGLFKKKTKAPGIDGMGMAPATEGFDISNVFRSMIGQSMGQSTAQQPVNVDTSGIEQKLNNFINALQNIQINMDGTQVGKVLVNASDAAMSAGVFRAQTSR